jgi:hypothetical protein
MTLDILLKTLALAALLAGQTVAAVFRDEQLADPENIKKGLLRSSGGGRVSRKLFVRIAAFVHPSSRLDAPLLTLLTFLRLSYFMHK